MLGPVALSDSVPILQQKLAEKVHMVEQLQQTLQQTEDKLKQREKELQTIATIAKQNYSFLESLRNQLKQQLPIHLPDIISQYTNANHEILTVSSHNTQ